MVIPYPYPHIVIEDALDEEVYNQLEENFPADERFAPGHKLQSNVRYNMPAAQCLTPSANATLPDVWLDFVRYHSSPDFYREVADLFGSLLPHFRRDLKVLRSDMHRVRTAVRGWEKNVTDISLEAQIAINSPVKKESSVRRAHYDDPAEIYAGLLYFRHDNDTSKGGDLEVYKCKGRCRKATERQAKRLGLRSSQKEFFAPNTLQRTNVVRYAKNVFVLFINSVKSLHGVTKRGVTRFSRRIVNFTAQVRAGMVKQAPRG
ncbi:hypothetical protein CYMTET_42703 [Cymbomonas tetramitiformis]|uniref:Prolyl 4-hydroxylase alpha subunit Fe(2+) 2OG dioxygenase domain-containing protein n=1 Tax=Cymbomonas tetramitiformis TaxID=36881 RepID=A0AAE0F190_9CHLO|nr:hypothetical protein CYMTET_42703 [Cymbomonas tetramitiformis]|eukprot:gene23311-28209_t